MIKKVALSKVMSEIESCNPEFYRIINEIAGMLTQQQQYVYQADFQYGEKTINFGNFVAFECGPRESYRLNNEFDRNDFSFDSFKEDLGFNKGMSFPLSVVIKGNVEIYHERFINKEDEKILNTIPLKLLKEGSLFGTWDTIDRLLSAGEEQMTENWHGVAGRECFVPFFKDYTVFQSDGRTKKGRIENYDRIFQYVFGFDDKDKIEYFEANRAIQSFIRENCKDECTTSFLCFPTFYFEATENYNLLKCLFKNGWADKNAEREMYWENLTLTSTMMENFEEEDVSSSNALFINHLIKIAKGKHFYLKAVSSEDTVEYKAFEKMVEKISTITIHEKRFCTNAFYTLDPIHFPDGTRKAPTSIFQIFHPLFMYYDMGWHHDSKGFTFLGRPPLMNHNFIDPDRNIDLQVDSHILSRYKENVSSVIEKLVPASSATIQMDLFKYNKDPLTDFMNTSFGYLAKGQSGFEAMQKFEDHHELLYLKPARNNFPDIFKDGTIYLSTKTKNDGNL